MNKTKIMDRVKVLKEQFDGLNKQIAQYEQAIKQALTNRNGVEGALIDCEHWLKELETENKTEKKQNSKGGK